MRAININLTRPGYRCLDCGHIGERKSWNAPAPRVCPVCAPFVVKRYAIAHMKRGGGIACGACQHETPERAGMTHCDSCGVQFNKLRTWGGATLSPRMIGTRRGG